MTQVLGAKPLVWVHGNTHYEFSTPTASGNKKHSHSYVISGEEQYTYWSWASLGKATPYLYCHGTGPDGLLEGSKTTQALTMKQVTLGTSGHDFFITCYIIIWYEWKTLYCLRMSYVLCNIQWNQPVICFRKLLFCLWPMQEMSYSISAILDNTVKALFINLSCPVCRR